MRGSSKLEVINVFTSDTVWIGWLGMLGLVLAVMYSMNKTSQPTPKELQE